MNIFNNYNKKKIFGNKIAILTILNKPKINILPIYPIIKKYYNEEILSFIFTNYKHIIDKYKKKTNENKKINNNSNIWVFWWQGINEAPIIVKSCIESIEKNKGNHNVIIIDKYNYSNYIKIPDYILKKVKKGNITLTHFSDILRILLLYEYGGIWIDSTVFLSEQLSKDIYNLSFYTNKLKNKNVEYISQCMWSGFFLCCNKKNLLIGFVKEILLEYWENYDELITYLFMDYIIFTGYQYIFEIKKQIDDVPYNNMNIYSLIDNINSEYNKEKYTEIRKDTWLFKLSWKKILKEYTYDNKTTFYTKLINKDL